MRNPKWHRDEIVLALDLYFHPDRGSLDSKNPKIVELSHILNQLPLFAARPDAQKFRNPNGVVFKLCNFLPFDKDYKGKGMANGSILDEELFNKYVNNKGELRRLAGEIRALVADPNTLSAILSIEDDEQTVKDSVSEGTVFYKWHKCLERNKRIVKKKKESAFKKHGRLFCEVCGFDFAEVYGDLGHGFIECHHKMPLSQIGTHTTTTLDDLALVCANCHRILHRDIKKLSVELLIERIKAPKLFPEYK
jgi:5-methylcytosine-specific restriction protein A